MIAFDPEGPQDILAALRLPVAVEGIGPMVDALQILYGVESLLVVSQGQYLLISRSDET